MSKIGDHSLTRSALQAVVKGQWQAMLRLAARHGVASEDCEDLVQRAALRVSQLALMDELAQLAGSRARSAQNVQRAGDLLAALLVHYIVQYEIPGYRRVRMREAENAARLASSRAVETREAAMHELLVDLFDPGEIDIDQFLEGDLAEATKLYDRLYSRSGLTADERRFAAWRQEHAHAHEYEFAGGFEAYEVSRIKKSAIKKVRYFLRHGRQWAREAAIG